MRVIIALLFIGIFHSCYTTSTTGSNTQGIDISVDLTENLRRQPGVQVNGSGRDARISIRGVSSTNSGNEPLYLYNGQIINGGYSSLYNMVIIQSVTKIRVLREPSETAVYGVRGSNGVIEILAK